MPLFRDAGAQYPNVRPGLLELLTKNCNHAITAKDFVAHLYGVLAPPGFTERFADELAGRELRVPITKDSNLFERGSALGAKLLWLHTYGERFVPKGKTRGKVSKGKARNTKAVPGDAANYPEKYAYNENTQTLHVGDGVFKPV